MIQLLFNSLMSLLTGLVKILILPLNLLITSTLPDISTNITNTTTTIIQFFNNLAWPLSITPSKVCKRCLFYQNLIF